LQGTSCYLNLWPLQGIAIHAHWSHFVLLKQSSSSQDASVLIAGEKIYLDRQYLIADVHLQHVLRHMPTR